MSPNLMKRTCTLKNCLECRKAEEGDTFGIDANGIVHAKGDPVNIKYGEKIEPKVDKIPNILEEANNIVHGDRNEAYGHPEDNHTTTAILFSHFLKRKYGKGMGTTPLLDAEDVCFFNILQKISRAANSYRRDNLVDIAGFAANIEMIKDQEVTEIHSERR